MLVVRSLKITHLLITICVISTVFVFLFWLDSGDHFIPGWPPDQSRDIKKYLLDAHEELELDIFPKDFCKRKVFLLSMITSSPSNFEHRVAVRETYGSSRLVAGEQVDVYFVLGGTPYLDVQDRIYEESSKYGDIIQGTFGDSYYNLTLKVVFMMGVLSSYCQNATTFVLKTDDDTYVNMKALVHALKTEYFGRNEILGHIYQGVDKITSSSSKWYTPDYLYPDNTFPNFASGTGYVMSLQTAETLYKTALDTPLIHLEDVFLTGICATKANIKHINDDKFMYSSRIDICRIADVYTVHWISRIPPRIMRQIHQLMEDEAAISRCSSYIYGLWTYMSAVFSF